jgi:hypothetical protein
MILARQIMLNDMKRHYEKMQEEALYYEQKCVKLQFELDGLKIRKSVSFKKSVVLSVVIVIATWIIMSEYGLVILCRKYND